MTLKRNAKLINKKFITYLIPSILMVFAMQFGSLLDGILVGNMIGPEALSATALVVPILYFIQLPGFALGIGGSIVIANLLGKRDIEKAKKTFSISIVVGVGLSLLFSALAFAVSMPIARLFSSDLVDYSYQYILGYFLTVPFITLALLLGNFMAVDNNPRLSSICFIVSNAAKVGLEVLFILTFKEWATFGAAISTGLGYLVGLITIIFYIRSKKRNLSFSFKLKGSGFIDIAKASSTSALNFLLTAIQMLIVNIFIGQLIIEDYQLAIYGLISNAVFLFELLCGGILNVIPAICGIFYGEKDIYSLKKLTRRIYLINLGVALVLIAAIAIFPNIYSLMFGYLDEIHTDYQFMIIRLYLLSFIPYEINKFSMNYYPSIDKNLPSIVTVLCRELVIVLPVTLVFLFTMGLQGYVISSIIVESATVVATYIFILIYEKVKKNECHGIFMFEEDKYKTFDVSIVNDINNASIVSEQLTKFALENNTANRESQIVGLASEEIINNIITYGYKKDRQNYIDISLKISESALLLRIRDDGLPFDPTKYEFDNDNNYSTSGIQLISKLVNKMTYMRVLSLNNTIFEISLGGSTNGN